MQPAKLCSIGNLKQELVRRASRVWVKGGLSKDLVVSASSIASFLAASCASRRFFHLRLLNTQSSE